MLGGGPTSGGQDYRISPEGAAVLRDNLELTSVFGNLLSLAEHSTLTPE